MMRSVLQSPWAYRVKFMSKNRGKYFLPPVAVSMILVVVGNIHSTMKMNGNPNYNIINSHRKQKLLLEHLTEPQYHVCPNLTQRACTYQFNIQGQAHGDLLETVRRGQATIGGILRSSYPTYRKQVHAESEGNNDPEWNVVQSEP